VELGGVTAKIAQEHWHRGGRAAVHWKAAASSRQNAIALFRHRLDLAVSVGCVRVTARGLERDSDRPVASGPYCLRRHLRGRRSVHKHLDPLGEELGPPHFVGFDMAEAETDKRLIWVDWQSEGQRQRIWAACR